MNDKDYIKDLFSEKLSQVESPVRPDLWNGIQAQLSTVQAATATTSAVKGISLTTKWIIGAASALVVGVSSYAVLSNDSNDTNDKQEKLLTESKQITKHDETESSKNTQVFSSSSSESKTNSTSLNKQVASSNSTSQNVSLIDNSTSIEANKPPLIVKERTAVNTNTSSAGETNNGTSNQQNTSRSTGSGAESSSSSSNSVDSKKIGSVKAHFEGGLANIITPNGDGVNDYLFVDAKNIADFSITVMNGKNQVVYKSEEPDFKFYPLDLPDGDYFYIIVAKDLNGTSIQDYQVLKIKRQ